MGEERVFDGVLHVLEGKTFRPLTAEELTQRLLDARKAREVPVKMIDQIAREIADKADRESKLEDVLPGWWPPARPWRPPFGGPRYVFPELS